MMAGPSSVVPGGSDSRRRIGVRCRLSRETDGSLRPELPARAVPVHERGEVDAGTPAEHRGVQVHQDWANLRKLHLEALPVGPLEEPPQLLDARRRRRERHAEDVALPLELHVRAVDDLHRVEPHPLACQHLAPLPGLLGEGLVDGRDVQGGQRRVDGAHVVVAQVRDHAPQRVRDPGPGRQR